MEMEREEEKREEDDEEEEEGEEDGEERRRRRGTRIGEDEGWRKKRGRWKRRWREKRGDHGLSYTADRISAS